jgi:purine-nucleoside phosphorylase
MCFACKSSGYDSLKSGRPLSVQHRGMGLAGSGIYLQNMLLTPKLLLSYH